MRKISLVSVLLSFLISGLLIPIFEINQTHLFNPEWPSHARLHEAWQLLTNAAVSALALYLVWSGKAPRTGITLAIIIGLSFLIAFALGGTYGGDMLHSDGTQKAVAGINIVILVVVPLVAFLLLSLIRERSHAVQRN